MAPTTVLLSLGWNGDASALKTAGLPVKYVIPAEGSQLWEDDWAIAAYAPYPDEAHAFINFVQRPEIAAQEARYTAYATGNHAAYTLPDEGTRCNPEVYPTPETLLKLEQGLPLGGKGKLRRERLWRAFRH